MNRLTEKQKEELCALAREAADNAYAPYSGFHVGAAILGKGGGIYQGCNVENASYGLTICAERNACTTMVAQGERDAAAIAIFAGRSAGEAVPCGACRQFLLEFCPDDDIPVLLSGADGSMIESSIGEMCPYPFRSFVSDGQREK